MQGSLHIPAITKGKYQLSAIEVEGTRTIVNVCIHVECIIGCIRQKFFNTVKYSSKDEEPYNLHLLCIE